MSESIKLFFTSLTSSLNPDAYSTIVDRPRQLGEISTSLNRKRMKNYKRISRVVNEKAEYISTR